MSLTNINSKSLSGYENNVAEPDLATFSKLLELYDLSADFIVKSIAGRTIDASLADIKRYLSKPWYLPAVWIKEIVKE